MANIPVNQTARVLSEYKSFCKSVTGNKGEKCRYPTRLDLYGRGCYHNCSYCCAESLLSFLHLWDTENPAVADLRKVEKTIRKIPHGSVVRLGGMTDYFQPSERQCRATYETIRLLNEQGIGYLIVTKSAIVAEDEYMGVLHPDLAHIQISLTTTYDALARTYERASPPTQRIKAIEKLEDRGFDVSVRLSPFIPQYIDFQTLNNIQCRKILIEFLRVNSWIARWFNIDYSEYTLRQNGYRHLPLEKKQMYLEHITGFPELTVCDDMTPHYLYWQQNVNHNPADCCNLRR